MKTEKVNSLVIDYQYDGRDGFPAKVVVDGVQPPDFPTPLYEKAIKVRTKHHEPICVEVEYLAADKTPVTILYHPETFEMEVGEVSVKTHPDRFPCQVLLGGIEYGTDSLELKFVGGEPVLVNLRIAPWVEPIVVSNQERRVP